MLFRLIRYSLYGVLIIVLLIAAAIFSLRFVDDQTYKSWLEEGLQAVTGREFEIAGAFHFTPTLKPVLKASDIRMKNAKWGEAEYMLQANSLELRIDLAALPSGQLVVNELSIIDPIVVLETNQRGENNWQFSNGAPQTNTGDSDAQNSASPIPLPTLIIENLSIDNARIQFDKDKSVDIERLLLTSDERQQSSLDVIATSGKFPFKVDGKLGNLNDWWTDTPTDIELEADLGGVKIKSSGQFTNIVSLQDADIQSHIHAANLKPLLEWFGQKVPTEISLASDVKITSKAGLPAQLTLEKFDLSGAGIEVSASGSIDALMTFEEKNINFNAQGENLSRLGEFLPQSLQQFGPLSLSGRFEDSQNADASGVSVKDLALTIDDPLLSAKLRGEIADIVKLEGVDVSMQATSTSFTDLVQHFDLTIPNISKVDLSADLNFTRNSGLTVTKGIATIDEDDVKLAFSGPVLNAKMAPQIALQTELSMSTLSHINQFVDELNFPDVGPLQAASLITSNNGSEIEFNKLKATISDSKLTADIVGEVTGVPQNIKFQLQNDIQLTSLDLLSPLVKSELPPLGPIAANGKLTATDMKNIALTETTLSLQDSRISGTGKVDIKNLLSMDSVHADVALKSADLAQLPDEFKIPTDLSVPASLSASVTIKDKQYAAQKIEATVASSQLNGEIVATITNDNYGVTGNFYSTYLDVTPFLPKPKPSTETTANISNKESVATRKPKQLFSEDKFDLQMLSKLDVELKMELEDFKADSLRAQQVQALVKIVDSKGEIALDSKNFADGQLDITTQFAHDSNQLGGDIQFNANALNLSALLPSSLQHLTKDGKLFASVDFSGQGNSPASLVRSGNGSLLVHVDDAQLEVGALGFIGGDVLRGLLSLLNPFKRKNHYSDLDCGIANFVIKEGEIVNPRGITVKTSDVTILGGGYINLEDESIDLGFKPKARKGLGLSASTVVKFLGLGGTLAAPKIELNPSGVLSTGATIGAAVSTGGLSLLAQGLFDKIEANSDVCKKGLQPVKLN